MALVQEGKETLPRFDLCGIHIPVECLIKHQPTKRCDSNTQMWWRRTDVVIASRCTEMSFSLTGEDGAECIEGVGIFKYLLWLLDQSVYNWSAVRRNIRKARQFWGRVGKLLWR